MFLTLKTPFLFKQTNSSISLLYICLICYFSVSIILSLLFSHQGVSDSLRPCELQQVRHTSPSLSPRAALTHVHWISDASQLFHPLLPPSPTLSFSQHQVLFEWVGSASGGQSIGASASTSVLLVNIQGWFPLWLTGLLSILLANFLLVHVC